MVTKSDVHDAAIQLGFLEYALIGSQLDDKYVEAVPAAICILKAVAEDDLSTIIELKRTLDAAMAQIRVQESMIDSYQKELKSLEARLVQVKEEFADFQEEAEAGLNDYRYNIP